MITLFTYLLKMIICSAILFLYYRLALRNKLFNQYNRFYLLGSFILSLILPLIKFSVTTTDTKSTELLSLLTSINGNSVYELDAVVITPSKIGMNEMLVYTIGLIGIALLLRLLVGILQIARMIRNSISHKIEEAIIIPTKDTRAPFSFFQYIFWRSDTSIHSPDGKRIFLHELAHMKERHSYDKLFVSLVLCVCWFNPFFWLMKLELYLIHEFIADKKAVKGEDEITALAAMLLAVYHPKEQFSISNNFFHSPIKRRLAMMTKINKQKWSYASRLFALPLLAILSTAIAIQAGKTSFNQSISDVSSLSEFIAPSSRLPETSDNVTAENKNTNDQLTVLENTLPDDVLMPSVDSPPASNLVYRINGTVVEKNIVNAINKDRILSINVITDSSKLAALGFKNNTSLLDIILNQGEEKVQVTLLHEIVVQGYKIEGAKSKPGSIDTEQNAVVVAEETKNDDRIFVKVEQEAQFPGGLEQWRRLLMKNLIFEPTKADKLTKGSYTVLVLFIVKIDGTLSSFTAETFAGTRMATETIRVLQAGPKWQPAIQNGKAVNSYKRQPVTFIIP